MSAISGTTTVRKHVVCDLAKTVLKRSAIRGETHVEASVKKILAVKVAKPKSSFSPVNLRIINDLDNSWDETADRHEPGCRIVTQGRRFYER